MSFFNSFEWLKLISEESPGNFLKERFILFVFLCIFMSVSACECWRCVRFTGPGPTGSCGWPEMGSRNVTQVLWKSNKCS